MRFLPLTLVATATASACSFTLDRQLSPGELRGTVVFVTTSQTQVTVAGARVAIENSNIETTTDAHGVFAFTGLPAATYAIDITDSMSGNGTPDTGLRLQDLTLPAVSGQVDGVDLGDVAIGAFGNLSGMVTNAPGSGVAAVLTGISQASANGGTFSFSDLLPGQYTVSVVASMTTGAIVTPNVNVTVVPRTTTPVPPFNLGQAALVTNGSVQGLAQLVNAPLGDRVIVTMTSPTDQTTPVMADAQGNYVISAVVPGVYTVEASDADSVFEPVSVPFVVVSGQGIIIPTITLAHSAPAQSDGGPIGDGGAAGDAGTAFDGGNDDALIQAACNELASCQLLASETAADCATGYEEAINGLIASGSCPTEVVDLEAWVSCWAHATSCSAAIDGGACTSTFRGDSCGDGGVVVGPDAGRDAGADAGIDAGPMITAPSAPTVLTAIEGDTQVTLTWDPPSQNGGAPIKSYVVIPSTGVAMTIPARPGPHETYVFTPVPNGTSVTFTVQAQNSVGPGPASNTSNAITPTAAVSPTASSVTIASSSPEGVPIPLVVTALDDTSQPIAGQWVSVMATGVTFSRNAGTTNSDGSFLAFVTGTTGGLVTITATIGAVALQNTPSFTPVTVCASPYPPFGPASLDIPQVAQSIVAADVNADGIPDFVVLQSTGLETTLGVSGGYDAVESSTAIPDGGAEGSFALVTVEGSEFPEVVAGSSSGLLIATTTGNGLFDTAAQTLAIDGGTDVESVVVADFNEDGLSDVAAMSENGESVFVLLQSPTGTYDATTAASYPLAIEPIGLVTGDFNNDKHVDLAATDGSGAIRVLLNKPTSLGSFQKAIATVTTSTAQDVSGLTAGDFNNDGNLDLILSDSGGTSLYFVNGLGTGKFTKAATVVVKSGNPTAMVVSGDFNGDGKLDVAAPLTGVSSLYATGQVVTALGNGDGTFGPIAMYATLDEASWIVADDLNVDGFVDLAAVGQLPGLDILMGVGDGTFVAGLNELGTTNVNVVWNGSAAADLNNDGKPDLVTIENTQSGALDIWLGNGDGTFTSKGSIKPAGMGESVAAADVNGDGIADLVVGLSTADAQVFLGNGDGTFGGAGSLLGSDHYGEAIAVADVNGDGAPDILVADPSNASLDVVFGDGDGTFQPPVLISSTHEVQEFALVDMNKDGKLDAVVGGDQFLGVMLGNGDGTFQSAPLNYASPTQVVDYMFMTTGDFNGDGFPDVAATNVDSAAGKENVAVFLNAGDGTLKTPTMYATGGGPQAIAAIDYDGDGRLDLVVADGEDNALAVLVGKGDGTFLPTALQLGAAQGPQFISVADFNADGRPDLVATGSSGATMFLNACLK